MGIKTITPIPDTAPAAVPELWNSRYREIDDNFKTLSGLSAISNGMLFQETWDVDSELRDNVKVAVIEAVAMDDSIDVLSVEGIQQGEQYVIYDDSSLELIRVKNILSDTRILAESPLQHSYTNGFLSTCSMEYQDGHALADQNDIYLSKWVDCCARFLEANTIKCGAIIVRSNQPIQLEVMYQTTMAWEVLSYMWSYKFSDVMFDYAFLLDPQRYVRFMIRALTNGTQIDSIFIVTSQPKTNKIPPILTSANDPIYGYLMDKIVASKGVSIESYVNELKGHFINIRLSEPVPAPPGIVMLSLSDILPDGSVEFNEANNKYLVGKDATYASPNESIVTQQVDTAFAGGHSSSTHNLRPLKQGYDGSAYYGFHYLDEGIYGLHKHRLTFNFWGPKCMKIRLCRMAQSQETLPGTLGYLFAGSVPSGFEAVSIANGPFYLMAALQNGFAGDQWGISLSTSGAHVHPLLCSTVPVYDPNYVISEYGLLHTLLVIESGAHTHELSGSVSYQLPTCTLKIIKPISGQTITQAPIGAIAMALDIQSIPINWYLCDGSNGTIDLRGVFIQISTDGNGNISRVTPNLTFNCTILSQSWNHLHWKNSLINTTNISNAGSTGALRLEEYNGPSHTHSVNQVTIHNYAPPYYPVYFIQYLP